MSARGHPFAAAARKAAKSKKDPKARVVIGALMVTAILGNNDVDVDTAGDADGGGGLSDASNAKCMHAVALAAHPVEAASTVGLRPHSWV